MDLREVGSRVNKVIEDLKTEIATTNAMANDKSIHNNMATKLVGYIGGYEEAIEKLEEEFSDALTVFRQVTQPK